MTSWPVSIGYFEFKGGDLTPSYQIDFRLYANGVSRELLIDYGDLPVHGTLTSLEYLKAVECRTPAPRERRRRLGCWDQKKSSIPDFGSSRSIWLGVLR